MLIAAGHGLGLGIAASFLRSGAQVILTDVSPERLDQRGTGSGAARGFVLDVTVPDQVNAVRARVNAELGPIDVLVNNAGVVFGGPFLDVALDRHLATVAVNLSGVLSMTHAFLPDLIARPAGHIVNIASAAALIALPMAATYAASKWAVLGFSESLREELRELGHRQIGVTAVCPGYISTGLFDGAKPARLTRWLTPEEVADAVVRAVELGREFVMLPRSVRTMYSLCSGWPRRLVPRLPPRRYEEYGRLARPRRREMVERSRHRGYDSFEPTLLSEDCLMSRTRLIAIFVVLLATTHSARGAAQYRRSRGKLRFTDIRSLPHPRRLRREKAFVLAFTEHELSRRSALTCPCSRRSKGLPRQGRAVRRGQLVPG